MRILLLHDDHADERPVARALEDAGHEIRRCAPPGKPAFPCMGATASSGAPSHQCPLDGTVDVAVVVHDRPSTTLAAGEAGVVCALRDGLPLVVAGSAAPSPYTARADAIAGGLGDVAAACDRAV
ncbi:MAG TPA: hypothetical protein VFK43_07910, partial [Acidimicrobiales bacterium]|nr:hypothetical protein [Acidimicrobiales bacterium]